MIELEDTRAGLEPSYRATIHNGKLHLTAWAPFLEGGTPAGIVGVERIGSASAGPTIADLIVLESDHCELIVEVREPGSDLMRAEKEIVSWAGSAGYSRVWLQSSLIEIEPSPEQVGTAEVDCPTCGARWRASSPEFWSAVRKALQFPTWCPRCGGEVPQWSVR